MSTSRSKLGPILVIVASLLVLSLVFTAQAGATPAEDKATATAWKTTDNIKIDGDLSEWNTSSPIVLENESQLIWKPEFWSGPSTLSAKSYLMWDNNNLYVGAEVTDDSPFFCRYGFSLDKADSLGLYLSTNPEADPARELYDSTDFRILLVIDNQYFDTGIDRSMVENKRGIKTQGMYGGEQVLNGYEPAVGGMGNGYVFEAKIPLKNFYNKQLPEFSPAKGMEIDFDLELNDLDSPCPGQPSTSMAWTGTSEITGNPSEWGTLTFKSKAPERPAWFVDEDSTVGLSDLMTVAYHYSESESSPSWLPAADVNGDGSIGLSDLMTVAYHYGEKWTG